MHAVADATSVLIMIYQGAMLQEAAGVSSSVLGPMTIPTTPNYVCCPPVHHDCKPPPEQSASRAISQTFADVQGAYAEADPLYARSLAIREKVLGLEHPDVASSLSNRAELLKCQVRMLLLGIMFENYCGVVWELLTS